MLIELMEHGISQSNGANLSQSEHSELYCIGYGTCEHETSTDLGFQVKKKKQFEPDFHVII